MAHEKSHGDEFLNKQSPTIYSQQPGYLLKKGALLAADFALIVTTTSILITVVQSPLKSIMMNLTKKGVFFEHKKPWSLPAIAALYRGSIAALTGGIFRSTYVVGTKNMATREAQIEMALQEGGRHENRVLTLEKGEHQVINIENQHNGSQKKEGLLHRLPHVGMVTAGDVIVTHISETRSQLAKAGLPKELYKWNTIPNLKTISKLGVVSRFSGSLINFSALCIATDFYAKYVPGENKSIKQTLGGMLSGITASVVSFPFNYYRDYLITKVTQSEGVLTAPKASQIIYEATRYLKQTNKKELLQQAKVIVMSAGIRALTTGVTFAIVAGVSSALGSNPVSRLVNESSIENKEAMQQHKDQLNQIKADKDKAPADSESSVPKLK